MEFDSSIFSPKTWAAIKSTSGIMSFVWDQFNPVFKILIALMAMDAVAAMIRVSINGGFSARFLKVGILLKAAMLLAVGIGHVLAAYIQIPIGIGLGAVFIVTEASSAWRNLREAGLKFPDGFFAGIRRIEKERASALDTFLQERQQDRDGTKPPP